MVTIRTVQHPQRPSFVKWLAGLAISEETRVKLTSVSETPEKLLVGQEMVEILHELNMDDETLQAALVFPYCETHVLNKTEIEDEFGIAIADLIDGVRQMEAIKTLHAKHQQDEQQVDNIRKMLIAMVADVRAVVIKMAERICTLQQVKEADEETRVLVARECSAIYAPLANRLGIGQLKWELEDLAFRYLHPKRYMEIARWLDEKRADRQDYIDEFVASLSHTLHEHNVAAQVFGRPKHIYSIYKKMQKKHLSFEQLFDIRAVRIIANTLQDCYAVLGEVHANYQHIPNEFDDYIATPKPNGYQSIHTVIKGPEGRTIEIQIRTQKMHDDAELGVAAHWKYKEDHSGKLSAAEERINWLRKILAWQEEVAESGDLVEEFRSQVFDDRVYVFTPTGDVIDLPVGSTPLDFAYYIHSNVGHRCIGAKADGRIVPFTYQLQSGDQVEILTGKQMNPSRDWMHPGLGYVHSSRARAKIHTYFKKLDKDQHFIAGKDIIERELNKLQLHLKDVGKAVTKFNMKSADDLIAAVGAGDIRVMSLVHYLQQLLRPEPEITAEEINAKAKPKRRKKNTNNTIEVEGVGHLMSQLANCCQPIAGEPILGYITQGRGVSVHKRDCEQLAHLLSMHPEREIDVNWASDLDMGFAAELRLKCYDRTGILKDITTVLGNDKIPVLGVNSSSDTAQHTCQIDLKIEVKDVNRLSQVVNKLNKIRSVLSVHKLA